MSIGQKGKKHTEEGKKNMSISFKGRKYSKEAKKNMSNAHKGKKLSKETKNKISITKKGKKWIYNESTNKTMLIYPEELEKYLELGWKIGRKIKD